MAYNKTIWSNGETPAINDTNLNKIENELEKLDTLTGGEAYDNTATYEIGDFCIYNNTLYRCTTAITVAEDFDNTHWTQTSVEEELDALRKSGGIPTDSIIGYDGNTIPGGFEEVPNPMPIATSSGTATSTSSSGEIKEVCRLSLNPGKYLILGACASNETLNAEVVQVRFTHDNTISKISGLNTYRGTMLSGGGTAGWIVINVSQTGNIYLGTYVKSTYTINGGICATKLLTE